MKEGLWPGAAVSYLEITLGILFLIHGLITDIGYLAGRSSREGEVIFTLEGIGSILLGLWLIILPEFFADILTFVLGLILIAGGIQQIVLLSLARRWMRVPGGFYIIPLLILAAGVFAMFNPTETRETALMVIGVTAIIYAVSELINWFTFTRRRPVSGSSGKIVQVEDVDSPNV